MNIYATVVTQVVVFGINPEKIAIAVLVSLVQAGAVLTVGMIVELNAVTMILNVARQQDVKIVKAQNVKVVLIHQIRQIGRAHV